jgi:hypothetical protein
MLSKVILFEGLPPLLVSRVNKIEAESPQERGLAAIAGTVVATYSIVDSPY